MKEATSTMKKKISVIKVKYYIFFILTSYLSMHSYGSQLESGSKYADLRANFLNIKSDLLSEIDLSKLTESEKKYILNGDGQNSFIHITEKSQDLRNKHKIFGAKNICKNSNGDNVLCWYSTGGTRGIAPPKGNAPDNACGSPVNNSYQYAIDTPNAICNEKDVPWSGLRIWMNLSNKKFLADFFPKGNTIPLNRLCLELQLPKSEKLFFGLPNVSSDLKNRAYTRQLVNSDLAPSMKYMRWQLGTYISPVVTDNRGTRDEEDGGTYQNGGSHFYHISSVYNRPVISRAYAIDSQTVALCIGEIPNGVRSGMRPAYAANPLLTLGGRTVKGETTALNYINYLTRIYADIDMQPTTKATYPFNIAINRVWMMYEENEIFAIGLNGETLGQEIITENETAHHPFDLFNRAKEERSYRLIQNMGGNMFQTSSIKAFTVTIDKNRNRVIDSDERTAIIEPNSVITLKPDESLALIISHKPNFNSGYHTKVRHGRKFSHGSISFLEEGRLRSASYAVRTWLGSTEDKKNKEKWFYDTQYPSFNSNWFKHKDKNQEYMLDTNPMLLRNTPDNKKSLPLRSVPSLPPALLKVQDP